MNKKKLVIIFLIIVILIGIYMLYNTFAINSYVSDNSDTYTINLTEDNNTITIPSKSSKTVIYQIKNTNNGKVKYAVGYNTSSNIEVKVYEDSIDKESDYIDYGEYKFVKLKLINNSTTNSSVTINTVLGYENGGNLIVPSNTTLVTEKYTSPIKLSKYITNLYKNNKDTTVTNNNIEYQYATSVNLMNDRLGGTTTSLDGGNIRYYGASPNNYVYFNCETYPSTNCELWRIIGVFDGKIKLMRNSSIGSYSWDSSNKNDWSTASAMKLLNPGFESETVGGSLYYNSKSGTCYSNRITISCDFTTTGIKNDTTRNMISETTYNTGGWNSSDIYSNVMYEKERGTTVYSGNSATWTGKVALPYPSDYGYAANLTSCSVTLNSYSKCTSTNWIHKIVGLYDDGWLLSHNSSRPELSFRVLQGGTVYNASSEKSDSNIYNRLIIPVLFLSSEQTMLSGDGSQSNPYLLSVN